MKYGGFVRMTGMCKSRVPDDVWAALDAIKDDAAAVKKFVFLQHSFFRSMNISACNFVFNAMELYYSFGVDFGTKLCRDLLASGEVCKHILKCAVGCCSYSL